jgi:shikimate dehydrogenase
MKPKAEGEERRAEAPALAEARELIDGLDAQILGLVNARMQAVDRIGAIKRSSGRGVRDAARETRVLERLLALNRGGGLPDRTLLKIYALIFAASRERQVAGGGRPAGPGGPPELFAVFGNPVGHSLSPAMHQAAFAATSFNGIYVPVEAADIGRAVAGLRALGLRGASVTLPHKEAVLEHLDRIDDGARAAGAVNTLVAAGGRVTGYNTDGEGALRALRGQAEVAGRAVAVIGAGGAARAIAAALRAEGARPILYCRTAARGERAAAELGVDFRPLAEFSADACEILVNTTPAGMAPNTEETPVPAGRLAGHLTVMDIVYNPRRTRLLREAAALGCAVVDGLGMFVHQGALQFELWTGLQAPVEIMRLAAAAELEGREGQGGPRPCAP